MRTRSSPDPVASLSVNGTLYESWSSGRVRLTMEELANTFEVSWGQEGPDSDIVEEAAAEFALDGDRVVDGYVMSVDDKDSPDGVDFTAMGQSKTCLLFSSAIIKPQVWKDTTVSKVAKALCDIHGIRLKMAADDGRPIKLLEIERGETKADVIARLCAKRGLIPYAVGGDLVIARVGEVRTRTVLERGVNVVEWGRSSSVMERYSEYEYLAAQLPATQYGPAGQRVYDAIKDPGVQRYRPLAVDVDGSDAIDAKSRAQLERNQRAGRGERITVTVNEWKTAEGWAWRPNLLVRAVNPARRIDDEFVIVSASYPIGAQAPREAVLELARPEAFDSEANYPHRKVVRKWGQ